MAAISTTRISRAKRHMTKLLKLMSLRRRSTFTLWGAGMHDSHSENILKWLKSVVYTYTLSQVSEVITNDFLVFLFFFLFLITIFAESFRAKLKNLLFAHLIAAGSEMAETFFELGILIDKCFDMCRNSMFKLLSTCNLLLQRGQLLIFLLDIRIKLGEFTLSLHKCKLLEDGRTVEMNSSIICDRFLK